MSKGKNTPIFSLITAKVRQIVKANTAWAKALDNAQADVLDEFDAFVRTGNRTDYRRDGLAASSGRMEPIDGQPGKWALTYSTMKGRRVDDILYAVLYFLSGYIYEPTERKDGKQNHRDSERTKWITSLGYTKEKVGKGQRNLFGDAFKELKDQLEAAIPERFVGTPKPTTQLVQMPLIAPPALCSRTVYLNVYRQTAEADKIAVHTTEVKAFLAAGFTFPVDDEGNVKGEIANFYAQRILGALPEQPPQDVVEQVEQVA